MSVRNRQKALNAINSFVQNSKGTAEGNGKTLPGVSLKSGASVWGCNSRFLPWMEDAEESLNLSSVLSDRLSARGPPSSPPFKPSSRPSSSSSRCCGSARFWSRSCWGRVPASHEGGPSTSLTHLNRHNSTALHFRFRTSLNKRHLKAELTLFDDVDDIVGIEAELIGVLCVVGVQSFTLRDLGFGFGCRFGSSSTGRRPADWWPVSSDKI